MSESQHSQEQQEAYAEHIATFDPPTVLRLIEELERARKDKLETIRLAQYGIVADTLDESRRIFLRIEQTAVGLTKEPSHAK